MPNRKPKVQPENFPSRVKQGGPVTIARRASIQPKQGVRPKRATTRTFKPD